MILIRTFRLHYFPASEYTGFYLACAALVVNVPHWFYMCHIGCATLQCVVLSFYFQLRRKVLLQKMGSLSLSGTWEKVAPLIKSPGYDLLNDDPGVHSDGGDFDGFCPDREWPDEELASHPDPAPFHSQLQLPVQHHLPLIHW